MMMMKVIIIMIMMLLLLMMLMMMMMQLRKVDWSAPHRADGTWSQCGVITQGQRKKHPRPSLFLVTFVWGVHSRPSRDIRQHRRPCHIFLATVLFSLV